MTHDEQLPEPQLEEIQQDDVVDKVDQLLSRHRPRSTDPGEVAAPAGSEIADEKPGDDGIPTLTDIVSAPQSPTIPTRAPLEGHTGDDVTLRRLETALETVRARLQLQIGEDAGQAHLLDQLVAVLKLALPEAVRSSDPEPPIELAQSRESPRL